jgi:hypothetical protein
MRSLLSWVDDLTTSIVQHPNRLRANLLRYYPQPLLAFSNLQSQIALHFLVAFPAPVDLSSLTLEQFEVFCRQHRYFQRRRWPTILALLQQPSPCLDETIVPAYRRQTIFLADQLLTLTYQKKETISQVKTLFDQHPDAHIFASLPGAGNLLAPKLLVMFGDHRQRYPHRAMLPAIAGTCPVTIASGNSRYVKFRHGCNHSFRRTAQQFAKLSVRQSVWAAAYAQHALARGHSKSHAYRCLANRWLHIIWALWTKCELYDEAYHLQQVSRHRQP